MWGWASRGRAARAPYLRSARLTVERCNGVRCSLTKNVLPADFIRARSFNQAPIALSSSPRSGCVVERPPFNRATCNTAFGVHLIEFQPARFRHAEAMPEHQQHQATVASFIPAALRGVNQPFNPPAGEVVAAAVCHLQ